MSQNFTTGEFGRIMGRWVGQMSERAGVVHIYLWAQPAYSAEEVAVSAPVWSESHANYEAAP